MNVVLKLFALQPGRTWPARGQIWPFSLSVLFSLLRRQPCVVYCRGGKRHDGAMKKLLRKLFPVPLTNGGLFVLLLMNSMCSSPLLQIHYKFTTDQKDVRSFYVEGVFKEYIKGDKSSYRKLLIASDGETYAITFWDKYSSHITREEIKQYLGEVFIIEYIKGPREWFWADWAKKLPYSITLKDGRQILNVDREEYIDWIWTVRRIDHITILIVSAFMLASLIMILLTVLSRLRNRGESP